MNFDFNDEQRAIKEAARDMLAKRYRMEEVRRLALEDERGFTDEQWGELSELGWPGIYVAEDDGGQGLGVVELVILQEELGYAVAPSPFFSNACAGLLLAAAVTRQPASDAYALAMEAASGADSGSWSSAQAA